MHFLTPLEVKRFLAVAVKAASQTATQAERRKLDKILEETPSLKDDYNRMCREFRAQGENDFMELFLKVLFDAASPQEFAKVRALRESDPKRWQGFQRTAFVLQSLGEGTKSPPPAKAAPEPMPEHVRARLLSEMARGRGPGSHRRK